jgi:hypothetical protein
VVQIVTTPRRARGFMQKRLKRPSDKPPVSPDCQTFKLMRIMEDLVVACGERDPTRSVAWNRGLPLVLKNGENTLSNSLAFREIVVKIYASKYGERPKYGSVTRALGFCNRKRYRKMEEN